MKKGWIVLIIGVFVLLSTGREAAAADLSAQIDEQLSQSGIEQLIPLIPEEGAEIAGDDSLMRGDLSGWGLGQVFRWIGDTLLEKASSPIRLLGTLCGILLLSALLSSLSGGLQEEGCSKAFTTASTLCVSAALMQTVIPLIRDTSRVIDELTSFMVSFIPVFTGVIAVSGRPASAAAYQSVTFAAAQIFAQLASSLIVPLLGIFLAVCIAGAAADGIDVKGIVQGARNLAGWVLGLCLTVFVALLTLQTLTTGAADTVGNRALKFVISSSIPVVGGALSEAYSSLFGCLGVVKSAIGVFGVIVMAASFLPVLANIGLSMLALNLASAVGSILGEERACHVIQAVSSAISVLGGLILCYGMMILSSSAILLWMGIPD